MKLLRKRLKQSAPSTVGTTNVWGDFNASQQIYATSLLTLIRLGVHHLHAIFQLEGLKCTASVTTFVSS